MAAKATKRTNKRNDIIRASADLFEKVGYHRATMQLLADEVGLGKPTLYHYFKSKNEILYAIHQETVTRVMELHKKRVNQDLPPDELLRGMAVDVISFIRDHPGYVRAFFEHIDELEPEHKKDIRNQRQDYMDAAVDAIKSGVKSGLFKKCNPRIAALGFFGMMNWTYKWVHAEKRLSATSLANSLCDMFLDGLKN